MSTSQQVDPTKRELKYDRRTKTLNVNFDLHGSWISDAKDAIFHEMKNYPATKRIVFEIHFEDHSTFTTNEQTTIRNRIKEISRTINFLAVGADGGVDQIQYVEAIFHMPRFSTRQLKCGSGFSLLIPYWGLMYTYETHNYGTCYSYGGASQCVNIEQHIDKFAVKMKLPNDG